jgi:hypothetical protein
MWQQNLTADAKHRTCAEVVGDVMGSYHPHGDAALYETLVRMAQSFSLRHPLIDGSGSFRSLDGDAAAAMRYTECRLAHVADEMLGEIEQRTVPCLGPCAPCPASHDPQSVGTRAGAKRSRNSVHTVYRLPLRSDALEVFAAGQRRPGGGQAPNGVTNLAGVFARSRGMDFDSGGSLLLAGPKGPALQLR